MHSDQTGNHSLPAEVDHLGSGRDFTWEPDLAVIDDDQLILARRSARSVDNSSVSQRNKRLIDSDKLRGISLGPCRFGRQEK